MNGKIAFKYKWLFGLWPLEIIGGPFGEVADYQYGVCLLETPIRSPDLWFPIKDFSVPHDQRLTRLTLITVIEAALEGREVYVGCMAGRGRTGLFLSLIAKAFGEKNPVEFVREHYYSHAVETKTQYDYVTGFDADGIVREAFVNMMRKRLDRFWLGWLAPRLA